MIAARTPGESVLCWSDRALDLEVEVGDGGVPRLSLLAPSGMSGRRGAKAPPATDTAGRSAPGLPLLDVLFAGCGRRWAGRRYSESVVGSRMLYVGHDLREDEPWSQLEISLRDPVTGLAASVRYQRLTDVGVLRSSVTVKNAGISPLTIESVSSFLGSGLAGPGGRLQDVDLLWAENDWQAEGRWQARNFREALPELSNTQDGDHEAALRSRAREPGPPGPICRWVPPSITGPDIRCYGRSSTTAPGTGRSARTAARGTLPDASIPRQARRPHMSHCSAPQTSSTIGG